MDSTSSALGETFEQWYVRYTGKEPTLVSSRYYALTKEATIAKAAWLEAKEAVVAPAVAAEPRVVYSPIETNPHAEKNGVHPNDSEAFDPAQRQYLDDRGDAQGQGLSIYWKWGYRAGWSDHKRHVSPPGARTDTERLDFVMREGAFIVWSVRDGTIRQCQLWAQNEDEEYVYLSGEHRFFDSERAAIDAAVDASLDVGGNHG